MNWSRRFVGGEPALSVPEMKARKDADALLGVLASSHTTFHEEAITALQELWGPVYLPLIARLNSKNATTRKNAARVLNRTFPAWRSSAEAEQAYSRLHG